MFTTYLNKVHYMYLKIKRQIIICKSNCEIYNRIYFYRDIKWINFNNFILILISFELNKSNQKKLNLNELIKF